MNRLVFLLAVLVLVCCIAYSTRSSWLKLPPPTTTAEQTEPPAEGFAGHMQRLSQTVTNFATSLSQPATPPAPKLDPVPPQPVKPAKPRPPKKQELLQIVFEDARPPLENEAIGPKDSARLEDFLMDRMDSNAEFVDLIQGVFGHDAAKEVVRVLTEDENATEKNARTCKSLEEFALRQEKIEQKTQHDLHKALAPLVKNLEQQKKAVSPAWKAFDRRVHNYERVNKGLPVGEPEENVRPMPDFMR